MRKLFVAGCLVASLGTGLTVHAGVAAAATHAAKAKPFVIHKIKPNPVQLTISGTTGSTTATTKVHWKGTASFPLTLTATPAPGCSTSSGGFTFTCNPHTVIYRTGSHALVYTAACGVTSSSAGSHTSVWEITLRDAGGHTTPAVALTESCKWG